jgi:RND family efflux transporter MFP subunit
VVIGTGGGTIQFLKDQQWNTEFMSRPAEIKDLATYFSTMGELMPVSTAEATVSAPLAGIISGSKTLPFVGKKVARGDVVAYIEPPIRQEGGIGQLTAGYAEAKNRVTLAQKEYERAKRLYDAKIAPLRRVEEAELSLSSAKAALEPLEKALVSVRGEAGSGRIAVRATVSGTVVEINAANGKGVEAGQPILRIINTATLWLKANLPAADAGKAALAAGATFTVTGLEGEFRPSRLVAVGDMLDPQTRTLPVIFEVPNGGSKLKIGMFANVALRTGEAKNALAVPREALVEDEGRWFLFVQTAGEAFERREVKLGAQDKGYAQVIEGLKAHERVVTKGAYYVKLAATAGKGLDPHAGHGH